MRETELKAVVTTWEAARQTLERAGATLFFAGRLEDRRYDFVTRELAARDELLRVRVYRDGVAARAELAWKGRTEYVDGYKVRDEIQTSSENPATLAAILGRIGFVVTRAIDREIAQYELHGAIVRVERYPRMDDLVEVEGTPDAIERAILTMGMPRDAFTTDRLPLFVRRYEERTGHKAALSDGELDGSVCYDLEDA